MELSNSIDEIKNKSVVTNYSYEWTISEFTSKANNEVIISPTFYAGANDLVGWHLQALPNGYDEDCKGYTSIFLILTSSYESVVMTKYEFSILNARKIKVNTKKSQIIQKFVPWKGRAVLKFIKKDFLLDKTNGFITDDDKLTIICDIKVFGSNNEEKWFGIRLPDHLQEILIMKKFSDVTLVAGNKEFQAHKLILAARSPVFSAMFNHDTEENKKNRVDITDIESEVLEAMLHFIYTDNVPNICAVAEDLLAAADKYQLERLKFMCEEVLCLTLNTDNVAKILIHADLHGVDQLKKLAIDYISMHIKEVMKTDGFKKMKSNSDLLVEILEALVIKKLPKQHMYN